MESYLIMLLLVLAIFSIYSSIFWNYQANEKWAGKAHSITRKHYKNKLYWVIEDGDIEKFKHVAKCFEVEKCK